jgi:Protein of unknown function (DUF3102)
MEQDEVKGRCCGETMQFDYDSVAPSVAKFLRGQAERIRHTCSISIIQAGKALIEAKHHLSHGEFVRWVRSEIGIPVRTVQAYMQVAQWVKGKSMAVANLPPSVLYILSGRSTPADFTAKLLDRHAAGEEIDARLARTELRSLREMKRKTLRVDVEAVTESSQQIVEKMGDDDDNSENISMIDRVICILVYNLPEREFEEIKSIFMKKSIFDDQKLGYNIISGFLRVEQSRRSRLGAKCDILEHLSHERLGHEHLADERLGDELGPSAPPEYGLLQSAAE